MRTFLAFASLALLAPTPVLAQAPSFELTFDESVQPEPYSGRVYVALSDEAGREPRFGMSAWFDAPPLYSLDVQNVAPGEEITIDGDALFHPTALKDLRAGTWYAQAVARRNLDAPEPGAGAGDLYGEVAVFVVGAEDPAPVALTLNAVVEKQAFEETEHVKLFELESALLSEFHGRPMTMRAGVVLPAGWAEDSEQRYPVIYRIPGFGGTHFSARNMGRQLAEVPADDPRRQVLQVVLDPSCYRGHHVFADSANNGPWGSALVEEFIPALEAAFHGAQDPDVRFVTGGSSGGWSSLWLQVTHPDSFGACYSHVPDPVDFRDFQQIDLYHRTENMFVDAEGKRRPLARGRGEVQLWYQDFVARETVLGPGGQIHSFEGCFSPRGDDGEPLALFDRDTGVIDTEVAKSWEPYDIRLVLERNWEGLAPELAGKLHIYAGEVDTFYLEGATRLLCETLAELESDAVCEVVPGMAHSSYRPGNEEMYRDLMERWAARGSDD